MNSSVSSPGPGGSASPPPTKDVVLVCAPHAKACEPTPGMPALAGHLRGRGFSVRAVDANLELQELLLSGDRLREAAEGFAAAGAPPSWVTSARRAALQAPRAAAALRDADTWASPQAYRTAVNALAQGFRVLSRARGARLSLSDLDCPGRSPLSSRDLAAVFDDPASLPFGPELEALVPGILRDGNASVIGVSAVYLSQALPAFALAGLLRRAGYRGRLVLGGGVVSSWAPRLGPDSAVFRCWDALVAGPGEEALAALAAAGADAATLQRAPGLLAPAQGIWNAPDDGARPPVCFEPDPEGLPWGRYLAPGPILPVAASRGCYWARCAFCPEASEGRQGFQGASPEALAEHLLRQRDRHGFRHVHFTDDAVPPAALRRLALRLRGEGLSWYGFARLERGLLDPALVRDLAAGGCAMLQLGVETASQRLLDLLGKGTRAEDAGEILGNLAASGIRTYVYLLFGVPTETAEEARSTLAWAAGHADRITFLNLAIMNLPKGSPLERHAGRYGVTALAPVSEGNDLSLYWSFEGEDGGEPGRRPALDRREARRILAEAKATPALARILARTPPGFTSNHAAWAPL